jgi:hypothetical protein
MSSSVVESDRAEQSRRWVREYKAATENMAETVWYSDLETREVSWVGKGQGKPKRKRTYQPKQKVFEVRASRIDIDGVRHAMQGQN